MGLEDAEGEGEPPEEGFKDEGCEEEAPGGGVHGRLGEGGCVGGSWGWGVELQVGGFVVGSLRGWKGD